MSAAIVTHGGVGSPKEWVDGCANAADIGIAALLERKSAFDAILETVVILENDGRYNAGVGSALRLDGKTVEMDASIMDSHGKLGVVAAIAGVKNPILVASEVVRSPHHILAGEGAAAFARTRGFPDHHEVSPWARERHEKSMERLAQQKGIISRHFGIVGIEESWNFDTPIHDVLPVDTVGAVARDARGNFAVGASTGGSGIMLRGRVGDTPLIGSGFFAGHDGAVAVTGIGEEIMKKLLAKTIYDLLSAGKSPQAACEQGVRMFPVNVPIGIIAVNKTEAGAHANMEMAHAIITR